MEQREAYSYDKRYGTAGIVAIANCSRDFRVPAYRNEGKPLRWWQKLLQRYRKYKNKKKWLKMKIAYEKKKWNIK